MSLTETPNTLQEVDKVFSEACVGLIFMTLPFNGQNSLARRRLSRQFGRVEATSNFSFTSIDDHGIL